MVTPPSGSRTSSRPPEGSALGGLLGFFCFVCPRRLFARGEHHAHVAPLLEGLGLDRREAVEVLVEALQERPPPLGVGLLTAAEHDRDLDLVLLAEEALDVATLGLVVVV